MQFIVLHPEALRPELVEYENVEEMAKHEFEHGEVQKDRDGLPSGIFLAYHADVESPDIAMLYQPSATENRADKQDMLQNVCINGETIGVPGVFMNGEFYFGTVAFANYKPDYQNMKTNDDVPVQLKSASKDDMKYVKQFLNECMVVNGTRHIRVEAIAEEQNREPVTVFQVTKTGIKEIQAQGFETMLGVIGMRPHLLPETATEFNGHKDYMLFNKGEGDVVLECKVGDKVLRATEGSVLAKSDDYLRFLPMASSEKQQMRKELSECLINMKASVDISSDTTKGKERTI